MPPAGQIHAQEGVAGLQQGEEDRLVGLGARVRLDVGEGRAEQRFRPLARQVFGDVHELAAAVIATTGITLGVFVGQDRPLRVQHRLGDDVLGRDQFDLFALTPQFALNALEDIRIGVGQGLGEIGVVGEGRHAEIPANQKLAYLGPPAQDHNILWRRPE